LPVDNRSHLHCWTKRRQVDFGMFRHISYIVTDTTTTNKMLYHRCYNIEQLSIDFEYYTDDFDRINSLSTYQMLSLMNLTC
jgi:hypothetical protein